MTKEVKTKKKKNLNQLEIIKRWQKVIEEEKKDK